MACNSCAKPFTLLRREKGCPGCGFSYCSKCLEFKVFLKKINAEAKVCVKCKRTAESESDEGSKIQPPDAYFKRIGATTNEPRAANAVSAPSTGNETDQQILQRLQKLKEDKNLNSSRTTTEEEIVDRLRKIKNIPTTSDADIQERLARLKGIPNISSTKPVLPAPHLRSEQEQAEDLLRQYMAQTKIDTQYTDEFNSAVTDIEARLVRLQGADRKPAGPAEVVEHEEDEEDAVKKIVAKYKAQAALEDPEGEVSPPTDDELPFCEICNEDAVMRCLGCRYLYCRRCYLDHRDDDDGCNRYEAYTPKIK